MCIFGMFGVLVFPLLFAKFAQQFCSGHVLATADVILNFCHMCMCGCVGGVKTVWDFGMFGICGIPDVFLYFCTKLCYPLCFLVVCILRAKLQLCFGNTEFTSDAGFAVGSQPQPHPHPHLLLLLLLFVFFCNFD